MVHTYSVRLEEVSKHYSSGSARYASLRTALMSRIRPRRHGDRAPNDGGSLAVNNLSLEIAEGESFGVIGPNGAGKTTLLKLISRISYPTSGRLRVRGRVSALIDVAAGVHPELTGRENVWLYGRILGMSRSYIRSHFDAIVEFAELGHVLDTPVKYYSSGMQLRLGFAIAAHLEPDIFLVDEALAVGDQGFQAKCIARMGELAAEGRTLILVSHYLPAIEAVCGRTLFLHKGRAEVVGPTPEVLGAYLAWIEHLGDAETSFPVRPSRFLALEDIGFYSSVGERRTVFRTGDDVVVKMRFRTLMPVTQPHVSIGISDYRTANLVLCSMLVDGGAPENISGTVVIECRLRSLPLLPRIYEVRVNVESKESFEYFDWQPVATFRVDEPAEPALGPASQSHLALEAPIHVSHEWEIERIA